MPICFAPVIRPDDKALIIGTMPGMASLAAGEYYAFKHNAFWPIVADISGKTIDTYEQKLDALASLHCGLWDNLQYCERKGSLDSQIQNEIPNNFALLLAEHPQIIKLLFNGQKSYQFFKKYQAKLLSEYNYAVLPSTSPAHAGMKYADKLALWRQEILEICF